MAYANPFSSMLGHVSCCYWILREWPQCHAFHVRDSPLTTAPSKVGKLQEGRVRILFRIDSVHHFIHLSLAHSECQDSLPQSSQVCILRSWVWRGQSCLVGEILRAGENMAEGPWWGSCNHEAAEGSIPSRMGTTHEGQKTHFSLAKAGLLLTKGRGHIGREGVAWQVFHAEGKQAAGLNRSRCTFFSFQKINPELENEDVWSCASLSVAVGQAAIGVTLSIINLSDESANQEKGFAPDSGFPWLLLSMAVIKFLQLASIRRAEWGPL